MHIKFKTSKTNTQKEIEMKANKKFVGQLKFGDRVQISQMVDGQKILKTYDITSIEFCEQDTDSEYAEMSLVGVGHDYVGTQTWYTVETIRVVE